MVQHVEAHVRTTADGWLLIALNHAAAPRKSVVTLSVEQSGTYTVRDLLTGTELPAGAEKGRLSLQLEFNGRDVAVLHLRPAR